MTENLVAPDWPDKEEFMTEFNKELSAGSDRALVLVTGAMTDELLLRLLKVALPFAFDEMFEGGNAVLSSWSARSTIVRSLGLISDEDYRRLNLLRKMRNDMAHKLSLILSDSEFVNRVQELCKGITLNNIPEDDRIKFSVAGLYLISMLSLRIAEVKNSPIVRPLFPKSN